MHDIMLSQWENITSVFWFRFWDAVLVRLLRFMAKRFPFLSFLLLWLVDSDS